MIITCAKCSTRFNLDDSLIKEQGSKVRCSVCQNISMAYPEPEEITGEKPQPSGLSLEQDMGNISISEADMDDDFSLETPDDDQQLSLEDDDFEIETGSLSLENDELAGDNDITIEDTSPHMEEEGPIIEDETFSIEEDTLISDGSQDIEIENEPLMQEDDALDLEDDDFELESGDFEIETADDDSLTADTDSFEMEDSMDLELETGDDDDFDGMAFEPLEEDISEEIPDALELEDTIEPLEIERRDNGTDVLELELDTASGNDENIMADAPPSATEEEEAFELEFDIEEEVDDPHQSMGLEEKDDDGKEPELPGITPEEDFGSYDQVLEQDTEPDKTKEEKQEFDPPPAIHPEDGPPALADKENESIIDPMQETPTPKRRRRKKKSSVGAPVLILMFLFFLLTGAYVASLLTGYHIRYLSDINIPVITQLLKSKAPEKEQGKPAPNDPSTNGRFVTNSDIGTLFVITGQVDNLTDQNVSYLKVTGSLFTEGKVEARTKEVFCGNIISEEILKSGSLDEINKALALKTGTHNSNMNIKPNASTPFMIVFSELPDKLQNFTVKVSGFEKNIEQ